MPSEWAKVKACEFFARDLTTDAVYLNALADEFDAVRAEAKTEGKIEAVREAARVAEV